MRDSAQFAVGSLVRSRGREWVVLPPGDDPEILRVRPLGGSEGEAAGILVSREVVEPASFALPGVDEIGDHRSCRLLRDALRLGFRSSAGPFRSFGNLSVDPRPYQLVPLLLALKLDTVRLLIADDVGIGKTIEALLIARELLDRGEIRRIAILSPPHLAEQWQAELAEKFNLNADLILSGTAARLERRCGLDQSVFDVCRHFVVSLDFIKSPRRRDEFIRACPEFVIVDEAHGCAFGGQSRGGKHRRWELVNRLSLDPARHLVLVTATPHSGKEDNFRSLLALLKAEFADLPDNLTGVATEDQRRELARYFIQRRRADIRDYLDAATHFPERLEAEETYTLSPAYRALFDRVLAYAWELVRDRGESRFRQRVRWWSALAMLRSLASSPAAAASTFRNRALHQEGETPDEIDEAGKRAVLDLDDPETIEGLDVSPGADTADIEDDGSRTHTKLLALARAAEKLKGEDDHKLTTAVPLIKGMLDAGLKPIVFCRFIPTAEYLAEQLRKKFSSRTEVIAVTGTLPPSEREARILELATHPRRVLVCTDCLSEGINLQEHFDAVFHYDLSWSPTRHEQREGRVDRYGQPRDKIHVVTYYGTDNRIDGLVLDVLIRKHKKIRSSLGISVPVPVESDRVIEAILEGLLLRGTTEAEQLTFDDKFFGRKGEGFFTDWEKAGEREKRSRTLFAQKSIHPEEVARELEETRRALGSGTSLPVFFEDAARALGGVIKEKDTRLEADLSETPRTLRDAIRDYLYKDRLLRSGFELPVPEGCHYLHRTHPVIENLATYLVDTSLDPLGESPVAARAGVISTSAVKVRTTLLLVRFRFHIITTIEGTESPILAEDCRLLAFEGAPDQARWLDVAQAEDLLASEPDTGQEIPPGQKKIMLERGISGYPALKHRIEEEAGLLAKELLDSHRRVRDLSRRKGVRYRVAPNLPPDLLGIYIYLP
ncbi:MAG: helicase-related protein [Candidatus Erginobacter occultus]|nr:helicase-related protein [Candidatus Erginobacter occultus]